MELELTLVDLTLSPHAQEMLCDEVTRALRAHQSRVARVDICVARRIARTGSVRFACALRLTLVDGGDFTVEDTASYPHSAVERSSFLAWEALEALGGASSSDTSRRNEPRRSAA